MSGIMLPCKPNTTKTMKEKKWKEKEFSPPSSSAFGQSKILYFHKRLNTKLLRASLKLMWKDKANAM